MTIDSSLMQPHLTPPHLTPNYVGRFAPSPTGPLHAGSLVAAMASYLDARAHQGRWLLRIEDLDPPREQVGAAAAIIDALAAFGFQWDGPIVRQSERGTDYNAALQRLSAAGLIYPCCCSRRDIIGDDGIYPGTCRHGMRAGASARAWRIRVDDTTIDWHDRRCGHLSEALAQQAGDFVLKRADGLWAYQLAVVVDDALGGVNAIVRGDDLLSSSARQIFLQQQLGFATPSYLHIPVLRNSAGEKLSKQTMAPAIDARYALEQLESAANYLQLDRVGASSITRFWELATQRWQQRQAAR